MSNFSHWFWPALSFVLFVLWLLALFRQRRAAPIAKMPAPGLAHRPAEMEDVLKVAYTLQEAEGTWDGEGLARALSFSRTVAEEVIRALVTSGWAEEYGQGRVRLTGAGEARARELVRAHRLWECYLVDREGMALEAVHDEAHRREHETTPEELEKLDAALGHPAWDPHGHPIPAPGCRVPSPPARPLLEHGVPGNRLRVVSIDDEPAPLLAQLVALGFRPGVTVEVVSQEDDLLRVRLSGDIIRLAGAAARCISVVPVPALPVPLGELTIGSRARVAEVQGGGKHQRRMLDMGFVPGAGVTVIRRAPLGDPTEYRIKGTAIALRREDADTVMVEELRDE